MDYARMPFAGGKGWRVINPSIHAYFVDCINRHYRMKAHAEHNPAPNPVSLMRADMDRLERHPYGVSPKSDGVRYLMLLVASGTQRHALMIDRGYSIYGVEMSFAESAYAREGSLLDGELVQAMDGSWRYLVFDCVSVEGKSLYEVRKYLERLDAARFIVDRLYQRNINDPFLIEVKRFYPLRNLPKLLNDLPHLDHPYDGLLFTPLQESVRTGKQNSLLKWKPARGHTIDAAAVLEGDLVHLQLQDGRNRVDWAVLQGAPAAECRALGLGPHNQGVIVECAHDPQTDGWRVLRLRNDKAEPNALYTASRTLQNIEENIVVEELLVIAEVAQRRFNTEARGARAASRSPPRERMARERERSPSRSPLRKRSSPRQRTPSQSPERDCSPPPRPILSKSEQEVSPSALVSQLAALMLAPGPLQALLEVTK
jgi:hypothetical protein